MQIMVCYFSNTGNTEKIAKSIVEGLEGEEVELIKIEDADPLTLKNYDLVVLGSGIYGGKLNKKVIDFMKIVNKYPPSFAFFNTHQSATSYQKAFNRIRAKIEENQSKIIGEFDCVGENLGMPKETILGMLEKLPPEERKRQEAKIKETVGHPNEQDLENAKAFGKSLIK
ncbi:MAG: flavodoxin domain-containing protein [Candidatus Lokiarchaeota archaeon]|nr:flavodoxin domain-containing protein [Candidatus Lokiarchaeota archaeon]